MSDPVTRDEVISVLAGGDYMGDAEKWRRLAEDLEADGDALRRENARLRDSLAKVKAAHDKTRQILGADVETVEDAAARVVRERAEYREAALMYAADVAELRSASADLCRAVALLADQTMLRAQWAELCDEPPDMAGVLAETARKILALLPNPEDASAGVS